MSDQSDVRKSMGGCVNAGACLVGVSKMSAPSAATCI